MDTSHHRVALAPTLVRRMPAAKPPTSPSTSGTPVARLLAAAAARARPRVAGGRTPLPWHSDQPRPCPRHRPSATGRPRRLTIVVAAQAACALVVAAAGVALAAGTGVLPNPLLPNPLVDVSTSQRRRPPRLRITVSTNDRRRLSVRRRSRVAHRRTNRRRKLVLRLRHAYQDTAVTVRSWKAKHSSRSSRPPVVDRIGSPTTAPGILADEPARTGSEHAADSASRPIRRECAGSGKTSGDAVVGDQARVSQRFEHREDVAGGILETEAMTGPSPWKMPLASVASSPS